MNGTTCRWTFLQLSLARNFIIMNPDASLFYFQMLPGEVSAMGLLLSGMLAAALTCIGLFVWRQVAALEAKLRTV